MPSPSPTDTVCVITCGALARDIDDIAERRNWNIRVHPVPPGLHNRPHQIAPAVAEKIAELRPRYNSIVVAYADCGSYGALSRVCDEHGVPSLSGNHCYDVYAGQDAIAQLVAEDSGTYFLTDYLVLAFDKVIWQGMGLDRYPELVADYFGNYHRVVWLASKPTRDMESKARRAAARLELPLEIRDVSGAGSLLESALAELIERGTAPEPESVQPC